MIIFEQEIQDGLEQKIKANASISYASAIHPTLPNEEKKIKNQLDKSIANVDDSDLYYVQSILVTSSWNKNDDIFDKAEVWVSRNTPEDKPTNLEHDEGTIIGHIVSNWPIDEDGNIINEDIDIENLPEKFHILTGSVIYKGFSNPELKDRSEKLISEIENGIKYVSMECYFKGFDYGLINQKTNDYKILARNAETSFLTKHLKAYGGLGEHEGYKIGRVLRGITFSGKGYVDKPANPDSIIFNGNKIFEKKNDAFIKAGVSIQSPEIMENNNMSLESVEKNVAEIKNKIEAMTDCEKAINEAKTVASDLQIQNNELAETLKTTQAELSEVKSAFEAAVLEKEEAAKKMSEDMKKKEEEMQKMKAEFDATNEILAAYKDKEAEMMKKEKKMKRMASLMEIGLDQNAASETSDRLESLNDEHFDSFAQILKATLASQEETNQSETEVKAEEKTESDILDTAEVSPEADLSVGGEDDVEQNTRAALIDFMYSRLNKKNLNKGE